MPLPECRVLYNDYMNKKTTLIILLVLGLAIVFAGYGLTTLRKAYFNPGDTPQIPGGDVTYPTLRPDAPQTEVPGT